MEGMKYISQANVSFTDLTECLNSGGYKAHLYNDPHFGERVIVYFEMVYDGKTVEPFCWWDDDSLEGQEQQQILIYERKDPKLKCLFDITYNPGTISGLYKVLKRVLSCYGGYAYCEGQFFDEQTIEKIQDIEWGQSFNDNE